MKYPESKYGATLPLQVYLLPLLYDYFFFQRRKENALTRAMWDSAKAIPAKLKTSPFPGQQVTRKQR